MSEIQTKPARFKKRYVAIVALAGLVATGGIVGATVTTQSTMAGNKITITKPVTPAAVTVTGSPVIMEFEEGETANLPWDTKQQFTLTNTGTTDATVKVQKIKDLVVPQKAGSTDAALFIVSTGAPNFNTPIFAQWISANSADVGNLLTQNAITVPANGTVVVQAQFQASNGISSFTNYSKTFPVEFDFVDKQ